MCLKNCALSTERQQQRMLSIDDDDGTTEYDPHEHAESLRHGIPDHFGRNLMLYIVHMLLSCTFKLIYI